MLKNKPSLEVRRDGFRSYNIKCVSTFHAATETSPVGKDDDGKVFSREVIDDLGRLVSRVGEPYLAITSSYFIIWVHSDSRPSSKDTLIAKNHRMRLDLHGSSLKKCLAKVSHIKYIIGNYQLSEIRKILCLSIISLRSI